MSDLNHIIYVVYIDAFDSEDSLKCPKNDILPRPSSNNFVKLLLKHYTS